jgi:hypothetical protein
LLGLTQRALPRGKFLVGIEGDTALVVEPDRHIALGRQGVTIFTPGERRERGERSRRYTHGQLIDWPLITPSR